MTSAWLAQRVLIDHNVTDNLLVIELAEPVSEDGRSVVLQAALNEPSEQERELGLDGYCLSDELGRTVYDCVRSCEVADGEVHLELSDVAVRLGFDPHIAIGLDADERVVGILCSALAVVLGRHGAAGPPKLTFTG